MTEKLSEAARQMGRRGGKSRSEKKQKASRENGRLGGRPKKIILEEKQVDKSLEKE